MALIFITVPKKLSIISRSCEIFGHQSNYVIRAKRT